VGEKGKGERLERGRCEIKERGVRGGGRIKEFCKGRKKAREEREKGR